MTDIIRNEEGNVIGMRTSNTLKGIDGGFSTAATQKQTFTPADDASLSAVQRAGVHQTVGSNRMRVTASNDVDFAGEVHLTREMGGTPILDGATAKSSDICQVGDLKMSIGAAAQLNLIEKKGSDWQLTLEGKQMVANRAGRQIEQLEAQEVPSSLDSQSQQAIGKLDALTRGRFTSAYLPAILHGHIDGKAPSFEVVQELTKATGASPELIEGMLSELCNKALDSGARAVGQAEGLSGSQVHQMIMDSTKATQKKWLVMASLNDTRGMVQLVQALRRKDIK